MYITIKNFFTNYNKNLFLYNNIKKKLKNLKLFNLKLWGLLALIIFAFVKPIKLINSNNLYNSNAILN